MKIIAILIAIIATVTLGVYALKVQACRTSLTPEQAQQLRAAYSQEELTYFSLIAFGNDLGTLSPTIHKWNQPVVHVKIVTPCTAAEKQEVQRILADLNAICNSTKFLLDPEKPNLGTHPDLNIHFVPIQDIPKLFKGHDGSANGTFGFSTTMCGEITSAKVAVANNMTFSGHEESVLREEIAQSIGLPKDTDRYPKSVFSSDRQIIIDEKTGNTRDLFGTEFLPIDKQVISILYNSGIPVNTTLDDFVGKVLSQPTVQ
jgi:hypothetical protein